MELWIAIVATIVVIGVIFFVVKDGTAAAEQISNQIEARQAGEAVEWTPEMSAATNSPADSWRSAGWTFAALGAIGLALSLFMKTSVETSGLYGATSEVVNLDLQFHKGLAIAGSLFGIGLGVFCLGIGAIVTAIGHKA